MPARQPAARFCSVAQSGIRLDRHVALDRRAMHGAGVARVVTRGAMHDGAVVPENQVAHAPMMRVDEVWLHGVGVERVEQVAAFVHR